MKDFFGNGKITQEQSKSIGQWSHKRVVIQLSKVFKGLVIYLKGSLKDDGVWNNKDMKEKTRKAF